MQVLVSVQQAFHQRSHLRIPSLYEPILLTLIKQRLRPPARRLGYEMEMRCLAYHSTCSLTPTSKIRAGTHDSYSGPRRRLSQTLRTKFGPFPCPLVTDGCKTEEPTLGFFHKASGNVEGIKGCSWKNIKRPKLSPSFTRNNNSRKQS